MGGMAFGEVLGGCGEKTDGTGSGHCCCMLLNSLSDGDHVTHVF